MNTEALAPRYRDLESWPTALAVEAMLEGQMAAVAAVQSQTGAIARAADAAAARLGRSGRLIFVGAGTSGRLAVQDGTELHPTFGWPLERMAFLMAGGLRAMTQAIEGAEDDADAGRAAIQEVAADRDDVVVGVAASGRTPFTLGAIEAARVRGALTIGIANNRDTVLLGAAEHAVCAETGSEVVAGSTRMKAGTAQKVVLNLLSTAIMIRLGFVYEGRMVAMRVSNRKLLNRARVMVADLSGVDADAAAAALEAADRDIRLAVLISRGIDKPAAQQALEAQAGDLGAAIRALGLGPI